MDYVIFLITLLQFFKFLDVTSALSTQLRKYFPAVAAIVVSSTESNILES